MLNKLPPNWGMMGKVVSEWDRKLSSSNENKANSDPNWAKSHFEKSEEYRKGRLGYYNKNAKNIRKIVNELDFKGDEDSNSLWQLCIRYGDSRPYSPISYSTALYRMREWYPERPEVKNGDVQWRLATNLNAWADAARRASRLPKHKSTYWMEVYIRTLGTLHLTVLRIEGGVERPRSGACRLGPCP